MIKCLQSCRELTTSGSISVFFYCCNLAFGFEELLPEAFVCVAKVLVLDDHNFSITDFFKRSKAQVVDIELDHDHTAATPTQQRVERKEKRKYFVRVLNVS